MKTREDEKTLFQREVTEIMEQQAFVDLKNMSIIFTLKVLPLTHKTLKTKTSSKFVTRLTHKFIMIATNQPLACLQAFNQIMSIQVNILSISYIYYWKLSYTELFCRVVRITANTSFVESCRPALKKSQLFILYAKVCPSKMWRSHL